MNKRIGEIWGSQFSEVKVSVPVEPLLSHDLLPCDLNQQERERSIISCCFIKSECWSFHIPTYILSPSYQSPHKAYWGNLIQMASPRRPPPLISISPMFLWVKYTSSHVDLIVIRNISVVSYEKSEIVYLFHAMSYCCGGVGRYNIDISRRCPCSTFFPCYIVSRVPL